MLWLIAFVLVLQSLGFWLGDPLVHVATALISLKALPLLLAVVGGWLLAGRKA